MIPICLVTGFLGTGKTTFLMNTVARNRNWKIVYLINEFSAQDVDGAIVSAENPHVVSIPGGSIFCKCLVTEFIGQLQKVADHWSDAVGVVIEASGMANPKVMESMLMETGLNRRYRIATILSVLDPNSFLKLRHTLPNILAQIEASDVVLINKTDLNSREKIDETQALIQKIQPAAERIKTIRCEADIDLFAERAPRGLQGEYAKCRDPKYATFVTTDPFDGAFLERFVKERAEEIYRVKGTLTDSFFDASTSGIQRFPKPGATPALAWIVKGGQETGIRAALDAARGRADRSQG